jgi:drug/metabolite transporter (DMT)-like permease
LWNAANGAARAAGMTPNSTSPVPRGSIGWLGEPLGLSHVGGLALILAGVWMASGQR